MSAELLLGRPVAGDLQAKSRERAEAFQVRTGRRPGLAIISFGNDPAADRYFQQIERQGGANQITVQVVPVNHAPSTSGLYEAVDLLNSDELIDGILVQFPLPAGWDARALADRIDPAKDVDGISPANVGHLAQGRWAPVPNTARAGIALLEHYQIPIQSRRAVIVGRSPIVGRPLGYLLLNRDATVTFCHSKTRDLAKVTRDAEILLAATGMPGLIRGEAVRPGATVLDFGTSVGADGKLKGDVDAESVVPVAGALTPVPGGIGPVTTACLLVTLLDVAERRAGLTQL